MIVLCCRDGTDELMTGLEKQEGPVLILSAGLGDLIKEILTYFKVILGTSPSTATPHPKNTYALPHHLVTYLQSTKLSVEFLQKRRM